MTESPQDTERLAALERYEILDTAPEDTFDRVVEIVAAVFNVPIALITLVDRERSWFKAKRGLPISQLDRADAMCDTVIRQDAVYIITDADASPEDEVGPLLRVGLRFYAAAPLRTSSGCKVGTVCAAGAQPREVTAEERTILTALAAIVIDEMELRLASRKTKEADEALRGLNLQLEAASRNKSQFLASMSHELRTPLNAILGASELLDQGLFGELSERQREYIQDIHESGNHLLSLIEDVLDLAKIEAGQTELRMEELAVAPLMEACASVVRGYAAGKGVALVLETGPAGLVVQGDERRYRQVVFNLLSNAVKFTPEKGTVTFSTGRHGPEVVFAVKDTGPGIPEPLQERVFEQFFRASEDAPGTGLGLPLARQLVELQGGRIWVESSPGEGSTFHFSLRAV